MTTGAPRMPVSRRSSAVTRTAAYSTWPSRRSVRTSRSQRISRPPPTGHSAAAGWTSRCHSWSAPRTYRLHLRLGWVDACAQQRWRSSWVAAIRRGGSWKTSDAAKGSRRDQARILWIREVSDPADAGHLERIRTLIEAAEGVIELGETDLALNLLWTSQLRTWRTDVGPELRRRLVAVTESIPVAHDDARVLAILAAAAPIERGEIVLERLRRKDPASEADPAAQQFLGMAATTIGDFVLAEAFLVRAVAALRAQGRLAVLAQALNLHAWAAIHTRSLDLAAAHAEEGGRLARETRQPLWSAGTDVTLAHVAGMRGTEEEVDTLAGRVEGALTPTQGGDVRADLQMARGVAALCRRRHAEAYAPCNGSTTRWIPHSIPVTRRGPSETMSRRRSSVGTRPTHVGSWRRWRCCLRSRPLPDSGSRWHALAHGSPMTSMSTDSMRSPWPPPTSRGGRSCGVGPTWRTGNGCAVVVVWPRLEISSVSPGTCSTLTAQSTGPIAPAASCGQQARSAAERSPDAFDQLTPQELQIARLAAKGLSNRGIGEQLYLSHRTIGFHLYHVFPKLAITSRAELATALGRPRTQPDPGSFRLPWVGPIQRRILAADHLGGG